MFQFEHSYILWFLPLILLIPAGHFLYLRSREKRLERAGDGAVIRRLFPEWSRNRSWLKTGLFSFAMAMMVMAWANPQWGTRKEKVKARSAHVVIALDISQSMLAEDVSPNRMERAKRFLGELIRALKGEQIGLIYFAGSAYLQMPLSADHASAELFIKAASPSQAGTQGTVIADAIELASQAFGQEKSAQKALIIVSDGENHESEAIAAAEEARENGTTIFTLGIGSDEGAYIPVIERGRRVYKKDESGEPVRTLLNKEILRDVANAGGGNFYMIDQTFSAIDEVTAAIDRLEKQEVVQRSFTDYNSYFQYFLLLAILFILSEWAVRNYSNRKGQWKKYLGLDQ